jgi:hypothetical protein
MIRGDRIAYCAFFHFGCGWGYLKEREKERERELKFLEKRCIEN